MLQDIDITIAAFSWLMGKTVPSEVENNTVLFTAKAEYVKSFLCKGSLSFKQMAHDLPISS
jgi:hypothetical protein